VLMANTMTPPDALRHRLLPDTHPRMAKADLRKTDMRRKVGRAVKRTIDLSGLTLKEFAAAVKRDERQCARWATGEERPHTDAILEAAGLGKLWIQALGEIAGATVEVIVRIA
jgi:hypothetical protein